MKPKFRILLILVLLVAILGIALNFFLTHRVDDLMRARISAQLGDNYQFTYDQSRFNILNNDFRIYDLHITKSLEDTTRWSFGVKQLKLTGFKPIAFIREGVLAADSITVMSPVVEVSGIDLKPKSAAAATANDSSNALIFSIEHFRINKAALSYDPEGPEELHADLNLELRGIMFEGNILAMTNNMERMDVRLQNIKYVTADSVYTIATNNLYVSKSDKEVRIDSFSVSNNISVTEYSRFMHWRKSLFDISVPQISMTLPESADSIWNVHQIKLKEARIKIMKDSRFPLPDRHTELPQEQLKNLALKFRVDSIDLDQAEIELLTRVSGKNTSDLAISAINGSVLNLQNYELKEPAYRLNADAKLMRKANLHAEVTYLYGEVNPFNLNGTVHDVKLGFIDRYLRRQVGIAVASGELDGISFDMHGDHNGIAGEVEFRYHDLRIHMVDKETDEDKVILNILSDSAGKLFFYRENPHKDKLRPGKFYVERDVRKGFISQWVDGLMQGIVNSISKREVDLKEVGKKQ